MNSGTSSLTVGTIPYDGIVSKDGMSGIGVSVWKDIAKEAGIQYTIQPNSRNADVLIGPFYRGEKEQDGYHPSHVYLRNPVQAITKRQAVWHKLVQQFLLSVVLLAGFVLVIAAFEALMILVGMGAKSGFRGYLDTVFRDIFVFLNGEFVSYPTSTGDRLRLLFVSAIGIVTLATMTAATVQALLSTHGGVVRSLVDTEGDVYVVRKGSVAEHITRDLGVRHETGSGSVGDLLRGIQSGNYPPETRGVIATRADIYRSLHEDRTGLRQDFEVSPYVFGNTGMVLMLRDGLPAQVSRHINEALDVIHKSRLAGKEVERYAPGFNHK